MKNKPGDEPISGLPGMISAGQREIRIPVFMGDERREGLNKNRVATFADIPVCPRQVGLNLLRKIAPRRWADDEGLEMHALGRIKEVGQMKPCAGKGLTGVEIVGAKADDQSALCLGVDPPSDLLLPTGGEVGTVLTGDGQGHREYRRIVCGACHDSPCPSQRAGIAKAGYQLVADEKNANRISHASTLAEICGLGIFARRMEGFLWLAWRQRMWKSPWR